MFTGIGGFELGFKLAGWPVETVWQADIDPFTVALCERWFPGALQLGDVTTMAWDEHHRVDVLTAGFPCQPVSQAGRGLAQDDDRWLWPEVDRAIRRLRPSLVILENVRGLRSRGLGFVLAGLRDAGYDCQWDLIPAAAVGAPHLRHRFAIVAYPANTHMGSIFDVAPPVFRWADEEPAKPRLIRKVAHRKQRLSALGNAIVPQWVAYLALAIDRAKRADGLVPLSLFGHTVESYNGTLPYAGVMAGGDVYDAETCAPRLNGKRLWPTPAANDAEWGIEALRATVHVDGSPARDPHMRLYHPGTDQIVQRTLPNYALGVEHGLWPTPQHADGSGKGASPERGAQDDGTWRSVNLVDAVNADEKLWQTPLAADASGSRGSKGAARPDEGGLAHEVRKHEDLWPTATASDAIGSRRATAARDDWTSNAGTTLTDAAWISEGVDPHTVEGQRADGELLWPTAAASDHKGVSQPGQRRGQLEEAVKDDEGFWPTPNASDFDRGPRSPEGLLKREQAGDKQTSLTDAVQRSEFWPTPGVADASGGRINSEEARAAGVRPSGHRVQTTLADAAHVAEQRDLAEGQMWETPTAAPWSHGGGGGELVQQIKHEEGEPVGGWSRDGASPDDPGKTLNPRWVEWLMGYPADWTVLEAAA
jgi:hypothetical protein